jgi:hypothetical protein
LEEVLVGIDKLEAFLSCSFRPDDESVNRLFFELCGALNIRCSNVDAGSVLLPAEVARKQLEDQALLIAICTRRDEKKNGLFDMPVAVRNEIGIAYGMKIPIQLFVEDGVELGGFETHFGTFLTFRRDSLSSPSALSDIVKTLSGNREGILTKQRASDHYSIDATKAKFVHVRTHMLERSGQPFWAVKVHKKTEFADTSEPYVNIAYWLEDYQVIPHDAPLFDFTSQVFGASGVERIEQTIKRKDRRGITAVLQFLPAPREGDWIEYETAAYSPFIIPMWLSETDENIVTKLKTGSFRSTSGFVATNDTELLTAEQRFPRSMKLTPRDIYPFAATYTNEINYEVPQETKRITHSCEFIGEELVSKIEVGGPVRDYMYGIAWNPKERD